MLQFFSLSSVSSVGSRRHWSVVRSFLVALVYILGKHLYCRGCQATDADISWELLSILSCWIRILAEIELSAINLILLNNCHSYTSYKNGWVRWNKLMEPETGKFVPNRVYGLRHWAVLWLTQFNENEYRSLNQKHAPLTANLSCNEPRIRTSGVFEYPSKSGTSTRVRKQSIIRVIVLSVTRCREYMLGFNGLPVASHKATVADFVMQLKKTNIFIPTLDKLFRKIYTRRKVLTCRITTVICSRTKL